MADNANPKCLKGSISDVIEGADVFIGLSEPGIITSEDLKKMAGDHIVFAMANPDPKIMPEEAAPIVKIMATGRSDYHNQINNVLCFPGIFRGALDAKLSKINEAMKIAGDCAIESCVSDSELYEDHIIPSVFNKKVVSAVGKEMAKDTHRTKVARRKSWAYMEINID